MLTHLPDEIRGRPGRLRLERIVEARRNDPLVLTEQDDFGCAERAPILVEALLDAARGDLGERVGQNLRAARILPLAQIEHRAGRIERVIEPLLHLVPEPAIDAAIQELEREHVDDQQRGDHKHAEDAHRARRQPRSGNVLAVFADQLPQFAGKKNREHDDAHHVDQQHPRLQPAEIRGVLHALSEQQQRAGADSRPQYEQRNRAEAAARSRLGAHTGSAHEYHSLSRCQSLVQNSSVRREAGNLPRRTPARTLTI